jgi:SAM-dependent methyltransferase
LTLSPEKQLIWFTDKQSNWTQFWQRLGFPKPPNLTGKRLLDVGAGLGGNTTAAVRAGATVVSLEPIAEDQKNAKSLVNNDLGFDASKVEFVSGLIEDYADEEGFDYILCDEVFEHLLDFPTALGAMTKLLRPGGRLVTGWGPLWPSPVGGHQLMLYFSLGGFLNLLPRMSIKSLSRGRRGRRIVPFSHRLFTGYALRLYAESEQLPKLDSIQQAWMNGYSSSQFRKQIEASPLKIVQWNENQGSHRVYKILRLLSKFPGGKNLFTSNIYAVLELPIATNSSAL